MRFSTGCLVQETSRDDQSLSNPDVGTFVRQGPRNIGDPAERFHGYLEDWILQQRAKHGADAAKEKLRAYLDGVVDSIRVMGEFGPAGLGALQLVIAMVQTDVLSVQCPTCGAEIGDLCWSNTRPGGKLKSGAHHDRLRAAHGEYVPQSLDGWLGSRRQQVSAETTARADRAKSKKKPGWSCHR